MTYGEDPNGGVNLQRLEGLGEGLLNGTPRLIMGAIKIAWGSSVLEAREEDGDSQDVAWAAATSSTSNLWDGTVIQPKTLDERAGDLWGELISPSIYAKGATAGFRGLAAMSDLLSTSTLYGSAEQLGTTTTAAVDGSRGLSKYGGFFSSTTNEAGGTIWTSEGAISQKEIGPIVNGELMQGRDVNIISGVHGSVDGTIERIDPGMFGDDIQKFGDIPGVTVHNFPDLTPDQLKTLPNGKDTVIGGFCNSGVCLTPFW